MKRLAVAGLWFLLAAAPAGAVDWAQGQAGKQADDLRIEAAVRGSVDYRKLDYASTDGLAIPAYLFRPLNAAAPGTRAAVIYVHGSQHGQFSSRNVPRVADLVRRGYVVLAPDYRSSAGYTQAFHDAADYGG
ncbi:MAG: hypothetical protein ABIX37_06245, partial [Gammaproteobacteria bacterium]